jgi:transmembrane sensor
MAAPTESDRTLAERLGVLLDDDGTRLDALDASDFEVEAGSGDQALMRALLSYRSEVLAERPAPDREQSQAMWAGISEEIRPASPAQTEEAAPSRSQRTPRRSRSTLPFRVQWAAFAFLVIGALGVTWFLLQPDPLREILVASSGDRIQTLTTADGSTVRLRPHSSLYRVEVPGADRYRLDGEGQFAVPPRETTPFQIDAGDARVTVLGTRFTVRTWTSEPEVYLSEGRVAVTNTRSTQSDTLRPGQAARVSGDAISVQQADSTSFVSWTKQRLVFARRSAASVARELEQHYDVNLALPAAVGTETISGELALGAQDETLNDFATVLGGRFEQSDDGFQFVEEQ